VNGRGSLDAAIWLGDDDEYVVKVTAPELAMVTRGDFTIYARSVDALRELGDALEMALHELERAGREPA
jgi:hypothetical protein